MLKFACFVCLVFIFKLKSSPQSSPLKVRQAKRQKELHQTNKSQQHTKVNSNWQDIFWGNRHWKFSFLTRLYAAKDLFPSHIKIHLQSDFLKSKWPQIAILCYCRFLWGHQWLGRARAEKRYGGGREKGLWKKAVKGMEEVEANQS